MAQPMPVHFVGRHTECYTISDRVFSAPVSGTACHTRCRRRQL